MTRSTVMLRYSEASRHSRDPSDYLRVTTAGITLAHLAIETHHFLNRRTIRKNLNAIPIRLPPPRRNPVQPSELPIFFPPLDTGVGRLQRRDIFPRREMLPVRTAGKLLRVVMNGNAKPQFRIHEADRRRSAFFT